MTEKYTPEQARADAQKLTERIVAVGDRLDTNRVTMERHKDLFGPAVARAIQGKFR